MLIYVDVGPYVRGCETDRVYRWCGLRRCCDRLVPPAVVLVELCELVLPRGMPQGLPLVWLEEVL
ncbi:hypothetical protein Taro_044766 [Colocasia esculenta]|uniref:Uncharacterized protein n=1 Tax=Colocasia esculenta TaxID=4460 RepID=A0A843WVD9_COLES|nr:hypothetical protein [Colocasia esculenta]